VGYARYDSTERVPTDSTVRLVERALGSLGVSAQKAPPVAALLEEHGSAALFWWTAMRVRPDRMRVRDALRASGLPDALAMIPYAASTYDASALGPRGERGIWLLPPDAPLVMVNCRYLERETEGRSERWLDRCDRDDRTDLAAATTVAVPRLAATWDSTHHDLLATIRSWGVNPYEVLAQHLLVVCSDAEADPNGYGAEALAHCSALQVPSADEVARLARRPL
jgi:hypothetical protein